jgi:hypothetical protein
VRWEHRLAAGAHVDLMVDAPAGPQTSFIELSQDGVLDVVDVATGAVRSRVQLKLAGRPWSVTRRDEYVIVHQVQPDADTLPYSAQAAIVQFAGRPYQDIIGAYDLLTGAERWRTNGGRPMMECGQRYLCGYEREETTVTDPQTGVIAYQGSGDTFVFRGDLLYVTRSAGPEPRETGTVVYQLSTGRQVRMYPNWRLAGSNLGPFDLFAQTDFKGRFLLAVLDPRAQALRVLGVATDWFGDAVCTMGRRYVGCTGPAGLRVWKLPPAYARTS